MSSHKEWTNASDNMEMIAGLHAQSESAKATCIMSPGSKTVLCLCMKPEAESQGPSWLPTDYLSHRQSKIRNITTTAWKAMRLSIQEVLVPDKDVVRTITHDRPSSAACMCQMAVFADEFEGRTSCETSLV